MRKSYEFIKVDKETSKILKQVYDYYGEQVKQPFDITYPIIMKFLTKEKYIEMLHEDLEDEIERIQIRKEENYEQYQKERRKTQNESQFDLL